MQPWCKWEKEKMQVFENQALAFCWVPGAGIEPARIAPLVFETSASTDSAIRAGVLCPKTGTRRIDLLVKECKGIGNFRNCKIKRSFCEHLPRKPGKSVLGTHFEGGICHGNPVKPCSVYIPKVVSSAKTTGNCPRPHSNTQSSTQYPAKDCYICRL